ncbi:MAG: hypothetical protein A2234_00790 [Elusimicrobia bacterium RIFOXYA2_FULL_58_8]|nr:MAG: hypothetical protein A2285_06090 [Elusimicrobia bacterium RIFOXYA12_FULL_57_11]OGS12215.1 MAG: hypothetical protein A2234_00790 [Elusimicrobia bacterium RIFOXYA2_FULL_58_8]
MWKTYGEVARSHPKLLPLEERCMIARAQAGSKRIRDKLVFHHIGFIMWRLRKKVFPDYLKRHGDDILSAAILELYRKVET